MTIEDKIHKYATKECVDLKYLFNAHLTGFIATVFDLAGVPRINPVSDEYIFIIKDVLVDEFYGGMEPEFETEEAYDFWENLNGSRFSFAIEDKTVPNWMNKRSPYQDKTIPFLTYIDSK
jgi:hypothetical protein